MSFLEKRTSRQLFGFISNEEQIMYVFSYTMGWFYRVDILFDIVLLLFRFEQWHIRVVVNNTPRPLLDDSASILERQRLQDMAEGMLRAALMRIFDLANSPDMDHIPPVLYDFDISCSKKVEDRDNNMYSRVSNMPPLFALDG